ncbi:TPA: phage portal protein family protein, partial [Salmonella enterica]
SKAVLGGTLTSQADGQTSTNALGGVHNEVRHDLMTSDARQTGSTLTRDVLYPLLALNGYQVDPHRMPRFAFDTRELLDLTLFSEAMPALVSMMDIPASWAYEKTGIPQPQEGEPLLRAPSASTPAPHGETLPVAPASQQLPVHIAALTQNGPEEVPPDPAQDAVDSAPGAVFAQNVSTAMNDMLAPLMAALSQGMPPEDAMEKLVELYPQLSTDELTQLTSQALFTMEIWGRLNA